MKNIENEPGFSADQGGGSGGGGGGLLYKKVGLLYKKYGCGRHGVVPFSEKAVWVLGLKSPQWELF